MHAPMNGNTATTGSTRNPSEHDAETRFREIARWADADDNVTEAALRCRKPRLVVSGRLAGGKDTVAEAVMSTLGETDAVRISFATALKSEVNDILAMIRDNADEPAIDRISRAFSMDRDTIRPVFELLVKANADDPHVHAYSRTSEIRLALQTWGTEIRRAADPDVWVKKAMAGAIAALAQDKAVYITDARFINEVTLAEGLGFLTVRLEVDYETRAARLWARDRLAIDPVAENHPSERELETYQGFDIWVDNSGPLTETVEPIVTILQSIQRTHAQA